MKDASFSHEMEVRAVIEAVPYDGVTLEIARMESDRIAANRKADPKEDWVMLELAQLILAEEAVKKQLPVAEILFLPVPDGFITQVSIDPRCNPYKQEHMRSFFEERGIPVASSTCFGYAANMLDVQPRSKLLRRTPGLIR